MKFNALSSTASKTNTIETSIVGTSMGWHCLKMVRGSSREFAAIGMGFACDPWLIIIEKF